MPASSLHGHCSSRAARTCRRVPASWAGGHAVPIRAGRPVASVRGQRARWRAKTRSCTYQEETDRYWNAIVGNGGQESACGWCRDKGGISWQITPRVLTEAMAAGGNEAKRAFDAMMEMKKIDVAAIKAARRG